MPNNDRISEVYRGEIWKPAAQNRARDRIHWMVRHARGRTLDLGCSQGIATILAAREGVPVIGVDNEEEALAYASKDRLDEDRSTQARCLFVRGEGAALPLPDRSIDTVLLGEVIEHLANPGAVLGEVARVLRPDGAVVLTTPFGHSPHHDHRQTYYVHGLLAEVRPHLRPTSVDVVDGYFRVLLAPIGAEPAAAIEDLVDRLLPVVEDELLTRERRAHATRLELAEVQRQLRDEGRAQRDRIATLETASAAHEAEATQLRRRLEASEHHARAAERDARAAEDRAQARLVELDGARARIETLRWEKRKMRARRGWRIAEAFAGALRRPRELLGLPARLVRILRSEPFTEPPPGAG